MTEAELRIKSVDTALEWAKQIITLSSGILVVSGTFMKDLFGEHIHGRTWLLVSWGAICVSIVAGLAFLGALCSMLSRKKPEGVHLYSQPAQALGFIHVLAFLVAMVAFAGFSWTNLKGKFVEPPPAAVAVVQSAPAANSCLDTIMSIATLAALGVSTVALLVAIFALINQRDYNRMSVKPSLAFVPAIDHPNNIYDWRVTNFGAGPAIIRLVTVTIDGKVLNNPTWQDIGKLLNLPDNVIMGTTLRPDDLLGQGQSVSLFAVNSQVAIGDPALTMTWKISYRSLDDVDGEFITEPVNKT